MSPLAGVARPSILNDLFQLVRRAGLLILAVALLTVAIAEAYELTREPLYQSSAQVLVSRQNIASIAAGLPGSGSSQADFTRIVDTEAKIARTPAIAATTVAAVPGSGYTATSFLKRSDVNADSTADLLDFDVRHKDGAVASRLATAYARQYQLYRRQLDQTAIASALAGVNAQLSQLRGDTKSTAYTDLVSQRAQLATLQRLQSPESTLLHGGTNAAKVQPKPLEFGVIALFAGLLLGVLLAVARQALDTRIHSRDELAEPLGLMLLGRLPQPPRRLRKRNRLAMLDDPNGPEAEAFRLLRTSFEFANLEHGPAQVVMVTSAGEGEGKSTTAGNLAVALARRGWRVTLADFDLRRPFAHRFFDLDPSPGLSDVVMGRVSLDQATATVDIPRQSLNGSSPAAQGRLEVLSAGTSIPDPAEFLAAPQTGRLMQRLRERSDLVIVDTPPIVSLGETLSLATIVDAMIVVTRLSVLKRPMLGELVRSLEQAPCGKLGYVITGAESEPGYGDVGLGDYYYVRGGADERSPSVARKS